MAYLSIRNLPEHLERRITQEARRRHTTKTAIVLEYLERGARAARLPADRPTLRSWSGKLSSRDLARVLRASWAHRVIDDELVVRMRLALDTSGYALFDAGFVPAVGEMERAAGLAMPTIVLGELLSGFRKGSRATHNIARLEHFIETFDVEWLEVTVAVARSMRGCTTRCAAGARRFRPTTCGLPLLLAAGAALLTADAHFDRVEHLRVVPLDYPGG